MQALETLKNWWQRELDAVIRIQLLVNGGAVLMLTYLGPFQTDTQLTLAERFAYWAMAIGGGYLGGRLFERFGLPVLRRRGAKYGAYLFEILSIAVAAFLTVLVLEAVFRQPVPLAYLYIPGGGVLFISFALWGLITLGMEGVTAEDNADLCPRLLDFRAQWPEDMREATLEALSAEDHYVRVMTSAGEALIAMRFADALKAVESLSGQQTHRSWWVASEAVTSLSRTGGNWRLKTTAGQEVPVSRRYRPEVRAQGWDKLAA